MPLHTNQGTPVTVHSNLFWKRCIVLRIEFDAMSHSGIAVSYQSRVARYKSLSLAGVKAVLAIRKTRTKHKYVSKHE